MPYPDELLEVARELSKPNPGSYDQARLRRAVSTVYYALFHFLILEATANWTRPEMRAALARVFEHGAMRAACERKVAELDSYFKSKPAESHDRAVASHLYNAADLFVRLQTRRTEADYNLAKNWNPDEVLWLIRRTSAAFASWAVIRDEPEAQAFLVSMLPSRERRQADRPEPPWLPILGRT